MPGGEEERSTQPLPHTIRMGAAGRQDPSLAFVLVALDLLLLKSLVGTSN